MNPNSIITFYNCVVPHISQSQRAVLEAIIELSATTDYELSEHLNKPINAITPRRGELAKLHLIVSTSKTLNKFKRVVDVWRANTNYKTQSTQYQQTKFGLEKAQSPLSLQKVKYFVRENGVLRQVN